MNIEFDFSELKKLEQQYAELIDYSDVEETNRKIVSDISNLVTAKMKGNMPVSEDVSKSGRGFGTLSSVTDHAANEIPVGSVKSTEAETSMEVGWTKSDNSDHFYVKFIEWGTIYEPPREFVDKTSKEVNDEAGNIADRAYQDLVDRKLGKDA